jgi:hypothetical protein
MVKVSLVQEVEAIHVVEEAGQKGQRGYGAHHKTKPGTGVMIKKIFSPKMRFDFKYRYIMKKLDPKTSVSNYFPPKIAEISDHNIYPWAQTRAVICFQKSVVKLNTIIVGRNA